MEKELPKGWICASFMEIFDVNGGTQPPKSKFISQQKKDYVRLLQIRDFGKKPVPTFIPNDGYLKFCKKDDLLIARYGASIGRIVTGMEGAYNVALTKVEIPKEVNKKFAFWLLKSQLFQNAITSTQRTAQNGFNKNDLVDIILPLPPKTEQDRIVAKLDQLFADLELVKKGFDKIPLLLKSFRQAVLSQAVSGKLTQEWRFGKGLDEWEEQTIEDVIDSIGQGWSPQCENKPSENDETWGVIKTTSIQPMFFDDLENKKLPKYLVPREKLEIYENDLLITRAGPRVRVGIACLVRSVRPKLMICDKVYRIRVNINITIPEYLEITLNSPSILSDIELLKTGISDSGLNLTQTKFKEIKFGNPPISEQQEIVRRVEALFEQANTIEARYKVLKGKIKHLPQAILAKAFRGELVQQLPTDGDARELLVEIKKMKEGLVGKKVKEKHKV